MLSWPLWPGGGLWAGPAETGPLLSPKPQVGDVPDSDEPLACAPRDRGSAALLLGVTPLLSSGTLIPTSHVLQLKSKIRPCSTACSYVLEVEKLSRVAVQDDFRSSFGRADEILSARSGNARGLCGRGPGEHSPTRRPRPSQHCPPSGGCSHGPSWSSGDLR